MKATYTLLFVLISILSSAQDQGMKSIVVRGVAHSNHIIELEEALLTYGVGLEARMGRKWSLLADFTYGGNGNYTTYLLKPEVRYYFKSAFSGLFLRGSFGFQNIEAEDGLLPDFPFDGDEAEQGMITSMIGFGFSTLVLESFNLGLHVGLGNAMNIDDGTFFEVGFNVGYAF
jgi:hypothetical protein